MSRYPHIRKVGAYGFFALCAFGVSLLAYAAAKGLGFVPDIQRAVCNLAIVVTFLALRDMTATRLPTTTETGK